MSQAKSAHVLVRVGDMEIAPAAQRKFRLASAARKAASFKLEAISTPVISHRDGRWFIVDGQHRIAAGRMARVLTDDTELRCLVFDGLSEQTEADLFLLLSDSTKVNTFDHFRVAITARWEDEVAIERIVRSHNLKISRSPGAGCIAAISALRYVYDLGESVLDRALGILSQAYDNDSSAFQLHVLRGMGLVCQRYDGKMNDEVTARRLANLTGGTIALTRKANALKLKTGHDKSNCMAAAIVETLNRGGGGKKLESWWR